jgi:hypothetical protein
VVVERRPKYAANSPPNNSSSEARNRIVPNLTGDADGDVARAAATSSRVTARFKWIALHAVKYVGVGRFPR